MVEAWNEYVAGHGVGVWTIDSKMPLQTLHHKPHSLAHTPCTTRVCTTDARVDRTARFRMRNVEGGKVLYFGLWQALEDVEGVQEASSNQTCNPDETRSKFKSEFQTNVNYISTSTPHQSLIKRS